MAEVMVVDAAQIDLLDDHREMLGDQRGVPRRVLVRRVDGRLTPLNDYLREVPPPPDKEGESSYRWVPVDLPGSNSGFLDDRAIYLSQCHGWLWSEALDSFALQRGNNFNSVEDFHNPEGMNQFLARYLENAGGAVFTVRERDHNVNFAISDNDGEGYSEVGSGFQAGAAGFADEAPYLYGDNPFTMGTTRKFPANGGGVARWVPEVPVDGQYALYVSWDSDSGNSQNAHYRVVHPGGTIDRYFDQTVHGSTWQYVETLWVPAGIGGLTVELVGDSTEPGRFLSADAVRIGGGYGLVERHGETTDRPRWEEGGILATQFNGAPKSVYDPFNDGDGSDPSSRARWAAWEHPNGEDAIYVSWHSNACGTGNDCSARGTVVYTYDDNDCAQPSVAGSADLAELLQEEIVDVAKLLWDPEWKDRGTNTDCFSENSSSHNPEMPSALIELAFHNNSVDIEYLKEPAFRRDVSRAMYRAIVRYFAERDGDPPKFLPEPPVAVSLRNSEDGLRASWTPGPKDYPYGDAAQSYLVYRSKDGLSWDNGTAVTGTSVTLDAEAYETVHLRVVAVNEGGRSFPSDVVSARRSPDGTAPILIVDAFDRFDDGLLDKVTFSGSLGTLVRMDVNRMNPADTASVMARAVDAVGWPFDSATSDAFGALALDGYRAVLWSTGEESTVDETVSDAEQTKLRAFVDAGGALWVSGAEVLWDLDSKGSASDKAFATDILGATLASDDAGSEEVSGEGLLEGLALKFGVDDGAPYPVEFPDVLTSSGTVLGRYSTNGIAAALSGRVALFGFPFEAIGSETVRQEVASRLLPALVTDYTPPSVDPEDPDVPEDTDAPEDTNGPEDTDTTLVDTGEPPVGGGPGGRVIPEGRGCGCDASAPVGVGFWGWSAVLAAIGLVRIRRRGL